VGYFLLGVVAYKLLPLAKSINTVKIIPVLGAAANAAMSYKTEIVTAISIISSIIIMEALIKPIDTYRQKRALNILVNT